MTKEFAIIIRLIDVQDIVMYVRGDIETARKKANSAIHIYGADNYVIAELKETFFK